VVAADIVDTSGWWTGSSELPRGEVTTLLSRHDGSAGQLLDLLDGRASVSRGSVGVAGHKVSGLDPRERFRLRREQVTRVQLGYGIYPKLTVRQNLVIAKTPVPHRLATKKSRIAE
jgi:ABC-type branched-subunit amino acid transport system ATPase component